MNEVEAAILAKRIPRLVTHEIRMIGNGEYVIALMYRDKIAFIIWDDADIERIPTNLRRKAYAYTQGDLALGNTEDNG